MSNDLCPSLIISQSRSGTHMLADALEQKPNVVNLGEPFHIPAGGRVPCWDLHLERLLQKFGRDGFRCVAIAQVNQGWQRDDEGNTLWDVLCRRAMLRVGFLWRRNTIARMCSLSFAQRFNRWLNFHGDSAARIYTEMDRGRVTLPAELLPEIIQNNDNVRALMEEKFLPQTVYRGFYEDLCDNWPDAWRSARRGLLADHAQDEPPQPRTIRVEKRKLLGVIENYRECMHVLKNTAWEWMLLE
jgi:hypothetical protein